MENLKRYYKVCNMCKTHKLFTEKQKNLENIILYRDKK